MLTNAVIKMTFGDLRAQQISAVVIHQTHYEKSNWSRAFNQFTTACELDMINAISAADIAFIMSSLKSAWLLSPLQCSSQKQNGRTLGFCFWGWIMWKMYNKTIIEFDFRMISWIIKFSTSDNAILAFWLVHCISVTSHYTSVWPYMEINAANVKLFLRSQVLSAKKWVRKETNSVSFLQKKYKKLWTIPSQK